MIIFGCLGPKTHQGCTEKLNTACYSMLKYFLIKNTASHVQYAISQA